MFGFLNINKPVGMTSFAVVAKLRKILGVKKIGHAGTLDPFAQGVLPIAIGKSAKLIDFLSNEKAYIATVQLGQDTDTYDIEGKIIKTYNKKVTLKEIRDILNDFKGEIKQIPPKFSAIKKNGKKLYELARNGQDTGEIPARTVNIKALNLLNFDEEKQVLKIEVQCSKGTYIRSLGYDIGQKLNCGAHLTQLIRTNSSGFLLENSHNLDKNNLADFIENPIKYLNLPTLETDKQMLEKLKHCNNIQAKIQDFNNLLLLYNGNIVGLGDSQNSTVTIKKVFYEED